MVYHLATNSVIKDAVLNISSLNEQPEYNMDKNCTAVLVGHHITRYTWIAIPCNTNITATYFCQSKSSLPSLDFRADLNPLNSTCDEGWFMMVNRPVCYLLLQPDRAISFYEGDKACSLRNSSIYRVDLTDEPPVNDMSMKKWFLLEYQREHGHKFSGSSTTGTGLRTMLFGRILDNRIIQNIVPHIVDSDVNMDRQLLATSTLTSDDCGIIQSLSLQSVLRDHIGALYNRWFFKYRPCSHNMDIISLICEKPSTQYEETCPSVYFQCSDGTCVLLIYVCDMSLDCFDASDETGCSNNATDVAAFPFTSTTLRASLPCTLDYDCLLYNRAQSFALPLHSLCDGIYSTSWLNERYLCKKNKLNHIHLAYMIGVRNTKILSFQASSILIDLFRHELTYFKNINSSNKSPDWVNYSKGVVLGPYTTNCSFGGNNRDIDSMCKISAHIPPCKYIFLSLVCKYVWCPGMFKCLHTYCLPMSLVCNGYQECPDGEDELFCSNLVCPGLLKCRGENRCVSTSEICDGQFNCQYSLDDEITCNKCPNECTCQYYFMSCDAVKDIVPEIVLTTYPFLKGFSMKGKMTNLPMDMFVSYFSLIYIDISYCGINRINVSHGSLVPTPNILFIDVRYNNLINAAFLSSNTLSTLVSADLSHNKITHIDSKLFKIYHMKVFRIGGNPLRQIYVYINENIDSIRIIDILHTEYSLQVNIYITTHNHTSIQVHVADPIMCCTLKVQCKVINVPNNVSCFQLIKSRALTYSFYFLTTAAFTTSISRLFVVFCRLFLNRKQPAHYIAIKINQSLCEILFCVYLICIFIGNVLNVNVIFWRKAIICSIMSGLLYIALLNDMVFKTLSVIMMSLKIRFPFKHQCRWLRFATPSAGIVWLSSCFIFLVSVHLSIILDTYLFLDRFCTFGECNERIDKLAFVHFTVISIDTVCICFFVGIGMQSYMALRKTTIKKASTHSHTRRSPIVIMFKVGKLFYIELVFRLLLYIAFFNKLTHQAMDGNYCIVLILLLLPITIILSGVIEEIV